MIMENKPAEPVADNSSQPGQDVVAPPPAEPVAEAPADQPADKPEKKPKPEVRKLKSDNSSTAVIIVAILILVGLSALAVYAYTNGQ